MQIKVLFFGATADIAGTHALDFEVAGKATPTSLINEISQKYAALSNHRLLIAVNEEYADADRPLSDGDEVAVFTAVSGG